MPSMMQMCKALWICFLQELRIKLEKGILAVITLHFAITSSSSADPLEPVAHRTVQLVIDGCVKRQQACEIYSEVTEVRVIIIVQIDEPDIEIASASVTAKEEAETVICIHEMILVRFHCVHPFILERRGSSSCNRLHL